MIVQGWRKLPLVKEKSEEIRRGKKTRYRIYHSFSAS
jgi:hypothetical protein